MMTRIKQWLAPPVFDNQKDNRTAYLLNIISFSYAIILLTVTFLGTAQNNFAILENTANTIDLAIRVLSFLLATVVAQVLMRRSRIKEAAYAYVILLWLSFVWDIGSHGGVESASLSSFLLAVIIAGLLVGTRGTIFLAGISVLSALVQYLFREQSLFVFQETISPTERLAVISLNLVLSSIYLSLYIRSLNEALDQVNTANEQLADARDTLENRVTERTQDLNLAAEIGQLISQIQDVNKLTTTAVSQIKQRFNLYHAQLYIANKQQTDLTLLASTGDAGNQMLAEGHQLAIDTKSLNGRAAAEKQPMLVPDTATALNFKSHKLLPRTRSEAAIPLLAGDKVVGVLDLQSGQANSFTEENLPVFVTLAGQLAIAIENSTLFTEQQRLAADLGKFKLGMERSADAIFLTDVKGTISYVNDAFVDIYGYTKEEAIGNTPRILKSGYVPQENYEYFWQTLLSGDVVAGEIINQTKNGRFLTIEGNNTPIINESNQVVGFLSMHRDITDRKQIEEATREQEALLRTIIDSTPDWIFIKDTGHRYQLVNQAYADAMHLSPDEFIGKNDIEVGFPEDIVKGNPEKGIRGFWADDREIMESGEIKVIDEESAVLDGKHHTLNTIKVPLKGKDARVTGIVCFVHDITKMKETEATVIKQAEDLQLVADLSTIVSTTLNTKQLLQDIVNRAKESFNLYHVHIYLLNEANDTLNLAAGAGEAGAIMVKTGYQIPYNHPNSLVAKVARTKQGVIVNNVMADPAFLPNPLLFDTRSELAVPMMIGNKLIGVLDAQANKINHFTTTDISIQTTLATQIAVAVENARAYEQADEQAAIIQNATNIIATFSLDGTLRTLNEAGLRRLGYDSLDDVLGKSILSFYPPDLGQERPLETMKVVQEKGIWQGEAVLLTNSGEEFPVDQTVSLIQDDAGQPKMISFNMTDITERKQAEEVIRRNETLMRTIIDSTPDWIFVKDSQYRYQLVNKAFANSLYLEPDAFIGKTVLDIGLPQEIAGPLLAEDKAVMESEETLIITEEEFPGDGGMRYQTLTKVILRDESGQVQSMVTYAHDTTRQITAAGEQKNLQQELEAQLERVNALQRAMTRENWQAFMTATASKRAIQGFEFNQDGGVKTLTTEDLVNGKNGESKNVSADGKTANEVMNPMMVHGTTIGRIGVRNPNGEPLSEEQRLLLDSLTNQVSEALDRARLFEETELGRQEIEEQAAELSTVNEISELVSTQLNINDLVNAVGDRLIETFSADNVYIALVDEKANTINFPYFTGTNEGPMNIGPRSLSEQGGFAGKIYSTKQPIIHNPVDDNIESAAVALGATVVNSVNDSNSYIGVPLIVGDNVIGAIGINGQQDRRMYDEEDIPLLTTLSSTIAVALQNAQQFEATQRRANREAMVNEISQKIQNASTIESAMQTAVAELGKALGIQHAVVELKTNQSKLKNGQQTEKE